MGPGGKVREFEAEMEQVFGVKHVAMVTSGTAALHTALAALGVSTLSDRIGRRPALTLSIVGYTIATFLTALSVGVFDFVAYQFVAGQDLPRVGYLTLIDKIMVISFLLLAITVLESYIVSRYGEDERDEAHRVDRTARWAFPLTYASLIGLAFLLTPG